MNKFMMRVFSDPKFSADAMEAVEKAQAEGESTLGEDIKMTKDEEGNVIVTDGDEKTKVSQNPADENDLQLADISAEKEVEEAPEETPEAPTEEIEEKKSEEQVEEIKTESEEPEVKAEPEVAPEVTVQVAGREVKVFSTEEKSDVEESETSEVAETAEDDGYDPKVIKKIAEKILDLAEDIVEHDEEEVHEECSKFCDVEKYSPIIDTMLSMFSEDSEEDQEVIKARIVEKLKEMIEDEVERTEDEIHEECTKLYPESSLKSAHMYAKFAKDCMSQFCEAKPEEKVESEIPEEISEELTEDEEEAIYDMITKKVQELAEEDQDYTDDEVREECGKFYCGANAKQIRRFSKYVDRCIRMFSGSDTEGKADQEPGKVREPETMPAEVKNDFTEPKEVDTLPDVVVSAEVGEMEPKDKTEEVIVVTETKSETEESEEVEDKTKSDIDPEPKVITNDNPEEPMFPNDPEASAEPFDEEQKRNFSACLTMEFGHVKQHNPVNEHLQMRQDKTAPKQKLFSVMTPDTKVSNPCLTCKW